MITKYPTGLPVTVQYSDVLFSVSIEQANVGLVCAVFGDFGVLPVTILKAGSRIKHQTVPVPMPTTQRSHLIRSQTFKIDATFGANAPSFFFAVPSRHKAHRSGAQTQTVPYLAGPIFPLHLE